jgi:hypothetical protein
VTLCTGLQPCSSQTCTCVSSESRKLRMHDKRHGSVLNASPRPAHGSVVKAESCACAIEGMVKVPRLCLQDSSQTCACVSSESRKLSMCESESWQGYIHVQYHRRNADSASPATYQIMSNNFIRDRTVLDLSEGQPSIPRSPCQRPYTVICFVSTSAKCCTSTVVSENGTLVEDKMRIFKGEYALFSFNKSPIDTQYSASAKFNTNSHEKPKKGPSMYLNMQKAQIHRRPFFRLLQHCTWQFIIQFHGALV